MKWLKVVLVFLAGLLLCVSFWVKTPLLYSIEPWASVGLLTIAGVLAVFSVGELFWDRKEKKWVRMVLFVLALATVVITVGRHWRFQALRAEVLQGANMHLNKPAGLESNQQPNTAATELHFGEHFIVGYTDPEEMRELIRAGVGGVFVAQRNAKGKTLDALREEIESFQSIRQEMGLAPLFIATDQEGGVVQKLSPPLSRRPSLREVANQGGDNWQKLVTEYAASQAAELKDLGVNVNFAPVVDVDPKKMYKNDKYTKISRRAISEDSERVASVAGEYVNGLLWGGVIPTLKHFPGLRLAEGDTHLVSVEINVTIKELENNDWVPFRRLLGDRNDIWLMMSHVKVPNLDAMEVIRGRWGFDGIIVTDDWSMGAIYTSPEGAGQAAVNALNNGVDIILVAFDPDVYIEAMAALLAADKRGEINRELMLQREQKIGTVRSRL